MWIKAMLTWTCVLGRAALVAKPAQRSSSLSPSDWAAALVWAVAFCLAAKLPLANSLELLVLQQAGLLPWEPVVVAGYAGLHCQLLQ